MDKLTTLMNAPLALQRLVALLLLVAALSGALVLSWSVVTYLKSSAYQIVEKRQQLGQLTAYARVGSALQSQAEQRDSVSVTPEFLAGTSDAVILAELQSRFNTIAAAHGIELVSVSNLPIRTQENVRFAGLAADVQGTNEAVHALLYDIETSKPFLVVRKVSMRSIIAGDQVTDTELFARIEFFGALPPQPIGVIENE